MEVGFRSVGMPTVDQGAVRKTMQTVMGILLNSAKCVKRRMPGLATIAKSAMKSPIVLVIVHTGMTRTSILQKTVRLGVRFIGTWHKRAATNEGEGAVEEVR